MWPSCMVHPCIHKWIHMFMTKYFINPNQFNSIVGSLSPWEHPSSNVEVLAVPPTLPSTTFDVLDLPPTFLQNLRRMVQLCMREYGTEDEGQKLWPYVNIQACVYNFSYHFCFADKSKAIHKIGRWGACMDVSCNSIKFIILQVPCYIIPIKSGLVTVTYITNRKKKHIGRTCLLSAYRSIGQQLAWYYIWYFSNLSCVHKAYSSGHSSGIHVEVEHIYC